MTDDLLREANWFVRNGDRRNPKAFINTDPTYFASECASAIMGGTLAFASPTPEPSGAVVEALRACRIELDHCQRQLAAHGQTGSPGNSVSRALEAARTALASLDAGSASS